MKLYLEPGSEDKGPVVNGTELGAPDVTPGDRTVEVGPDDNGSATELTQKWHEYDPSQT